MKTASIPNLARKPYILPKAAEKILRAVHFYRYTTALDIATLLFSPSSLTYVRALCSELAGGQDFAPNHWLYRFKLPSLSNHSTRIYTLGSKGKTIC